MSTPIEVACPHCRAVYSVARADLGREATCHQCGERFTARRWNAACWWILGAIVVGMAIWVQQWQQDSDPYRRPRPGGFYLAVGVPWGGRGGRGGKVTIEGCRGKVLPVERPTCRD